MHVALQSTATTASIEVVFSDEEKETRTGHSVLGLVSLYFMEVAYRSEKKNIIKRVPVRSINQSINTFITRHGTEARATVRIMPKQREMS